MKKLFVLAITVCIGIALVIPTVSYAGPRGPHGHRSYGNNDGILIAGAALGGIVLGAVLGNAMSQPTRVTERVVYNNPPAGPATYAYSDRYNGYYNDEPPGQWVNVSGQWVNGRWVPAHRVWMPVNPY